MAAQEDPDRLTEPPNVQAWACFHCGETFTTYGGARDHFGATPDATAGCLIARVPLETGTTTQVGRGLLMALRKIEAENTHLTQERDAFRAEIERIQLRFADLTLAVDEESEAVFATLRAENAQLKAMAVAPCVKNPVSSRICERGMSGCTVRHTLKGIICIAFFLPSRSLDRRSAVCQSSLLTICAPWRRNLPKARRSACGKASIDKA